MSKPFKGDLGDAFALLEAQKWEHASRAMAYIGASDYLNKQSQREIDEFLLKCIRIVTQNPKLPIVKELKTVLAQVFLFFSIIIFRQTWIRN